MASRSKKRSKGRQAVPPIDRVQRNLQRGDFKQALKDARICYRQDPTPDCRCFLEHAYIGRAQQLVQNGLIEDARRIVQDLLDLGVTEPAVEAGLPELLLSVGMLDRLPQGGKALSPEEQDRLRVKAADAAVLHPENTPKSMPELRRDARRIRAALEAVERGDDSAALEQLREIPRQSLFADWKYFVRGLIAYYRGDKNDMAANWSRLDPDRSAATITAPLEAVVGMAPRRDIGNLSSKIGRLQNHLAGGALLGRLTRLRQAAADSDWPLLLKTLRAGGRALREAGEDVYRRLISCLCGTFVHEGLVDELDELSRIVDPPPNDPRWNRAKAVASEFSEWEEDDPEEYWYAYLHDLEDLPAFSPEQRDLARGLVWLRLAEYHVEHVVELRGCRCGADHSQLIEEAEEEARDAFERCFALAPAHAPAYVAAATYYKLTGRPEVAAELYQRLLRRVPDHLDALEFLAGYHVSRGEGLKAQEFALRARELKPLDKPARELLWTTYIEAARELARSNRCKKARRELAAADRLQPARRDDCQVLALRAAVEIKADDAGAARRFVEQAQEQLWEPTALWLAMTIETIRCDLPWQEASLYEKRWRDALKRRCRGETAGLMCRLLAASSETSPPYPQHREHSRILLPYVRRCTRVKWQPEDLRDVCQFLEQAEEMDLLKKFAKKGVRKCPQVAYFHWVMGMAEMGKGPIRCNRWLAAERFQRAIELASSSSDPRDKTVAQRARHRLSLIEDVSHRHDTHFDDDDDDDDPDETPDRGGGNPLDGAAIDEIRRIIEDACKRAGVDPDDVIGDLIGGRADKSA